MIEKHKTNKLTSEEFMKKTIFFLVIGVLFLLITGCGTTGQFVYPARMQNLTVLADKPMNKKTIAIMPFYDYRSDDNEAGTMFLYLIPLFPYGYVTYDRPEAATMFISVAEYNMNMSEDLAKATATSFRVSNLFENAFYTFGERKDTADFNLTGDVYFYYYEGTMYTYGLSVIGPMLWFFGLPAGTSLNKIETKLYLRKKGSNEILWEYTISKKGKYLQGLYYKMGWDVKNFTKLYEEGMNEAIVDLQKKMSKNPKKFGL